MTRNTKRPDLSSAPKRPLGSDFTAYTMRHAVTARRRAQSKQQATTSLKDIFSMKSMKFMRTVPGAALAIAIIATSGAGVYALTNWFGGDVTINRPSQSALSVDLSSCKGPLPAGVSDVDRSNVQFKILGDKHIGEEELQQALLAQCELDAVYDFYGKQSAPQGLNFYSGTIKEVGGGTVKVGYLWGGQEQTKVLSVPQDVTVYDQGQPVVLSSMHVSDTVVFTIRSAALLQEGHDPVADASEVHSIFKTQNDTRKAPNSTKKGFYEESNIMPLNQYDQIK